MADLGTFIAEATGGSLTATFETRTFFTSFMGWYAKRLDIFQRGHTILKHEETNKDRGQVQVPGFQAPIQVNPHQVSREV